MRGHRRAGAEPRVRPRRRRPSRVRHSAEVPPAVPGTVPRPTGRRGERRCAHGRHGRLQRRVKLVPPIEKVRLKQPTATDGKAYVGVEFEYHTAGVEATRLELGLSPEDAAALRANLAQLGEKLQSREH